MASGFDVPVVVIGFNRPHLVRRALEAVSVEAPTRLFLIADGPRPDREDDVELCRLTRIEMERIDWPAEVSRRYANVNAGCEATVEMGLDWVFSQVDRAIVLEDDCIPGPDFFAYARELLDRYQDDERIWQIAGNRLGVSQHLFEADYAFSGWASVWGWATWGNRWKRHRALFPRDHEGPGGDAPTRTRAIRTDGATLVTPGGRRHFAEAAQSPDVDTHGWDKHWWLSIIDAGGLAITPANNLVSNEGFGADATHGVSDRTDTPVERLEHSVRHPAEVALDREVERELELALGRVGGRTARMARRFITSPRLRRTARSVVDSGPVVAATRRLSRLRAR